MDDARDSSWFSSVVFHLTVARGGVAARELAQFVLRAAPLMPETLRSSVRNMSDATDAIVFSDKSRIDDVNTALSYQEGAEAIVGPILDHHIAGKALRESLDKHQVVHAVLEAGHVDLVVDELTAIAPYLAQIGVPNATAVDAIDRASAVFP